MIANLYEMWKEIYFSLHVLALYPQLQNNGVNTDKSHFYQMSFAKNRYMWKGNFKDKIQ